MRRRRVIPAALAVVLLVGGQLAALAHNATTRHVTCSEHGEVLEAPRLVDLLHACDQDHWIGVEGQQGADHDDCTFARALQPTAPPAQPHLVSAAVATLGSADAPLTLPLASQGDLYRIAPKTSPPTAA